MFWHMITASELTGLSVPERLFEYAEAYRNASEVLCSKISSDPKAYGWPDAAVVLMLAAHSVELFLKGALLKRFPNDEDVGSYGHRLEDLSTAYRMRFTESTFEWDIPFGGGEYPGSSEAEIAALRKKYPEPSILYRYPVEKGGNEWIGLYGFEPTLFLLLLKQVEIDFRRIRLQLA
ncbi:hypothetical protein [Nitrospira sp. Nam80]